jgi:outer membrane protein assembly factor BamB
MPRDQRTFVFVGIKGAVLALDERSGEPVWRADLRTSDYVNVYWDGEALLAANSGEIWRIDATSGSTIWHNELKGLGRGLVSLATSRRPGSSDSGAPAAEKFRRDAAEAASA